MESTRNFPSLWDLFLFLSSRLVFLPLLGSSIFEGKILSNLIGSGKFLRL